MCTDLAHELGVKALSFDLRAVETDPVQSGNGARPNKHSYKRSERLERTRD